MNQDSIGHGLVYRSYWLLIGWVLVLLVVYGSLTPKPVQIEVRYFDKFIHLFSYFVLMAWFGQLYAGIKWRVFFVCLFVFMGIVLELLQAMGGMRLFEYWDMLANAFGVFLAWYMLKITALASGLVRLESRLFKSLSH